MYQPLWQPKIQNTSEKLVIACKNNNVTRGSIPLESMEQVPLSPPSPSPSRLFHPFPHPFPGGPPLNPARGSGERCKLRLGGPAEPRRPRDLVHLNTLRWSLLFTCCGFN